MRTQSSNPMQQTETLDKTGKGWFKDIWKTEEKFVGGSGLKNLRCRCKIHKQRIISADGRSGELMKKNDYSSIGIYY